MSTEAAPEKPGPGGMNGKPNHESRKERPAKRGGGRFEPYGNQPRKFRVFVSNIPFDVKWQTLKDLMKEKVGEVTYVEHLMDAEGKSRGCAIVEFRTEELVKKAVEKVNKLNLNGRPLKVKEDSDGEFARRAAQRSQGGGGGGGGGPPTGGMGGGMGMGPRPRAPPPVNIPPSLMDNPNIPSEVIHALQAGKIGSTVFVANLDYKVGWKKLKEVFGMAGAVMRTDILEDKDGKSRGMGTITFEMPIEAVQAVSMFNGQLLFNRVMHVKLDEKSLPRDDYPSPEQSPALPRGLSGVGQGLGPGGQPIDTHHLNRGGMGNVGPGGMVAMGYGGMDRMSGSGMDSFGGSGMDRYGPGSGMGRMNDMDRGIGGGFERDFVRGEIGMSRSGFGDSFERGMGSSMGMDRMGSGMDRIGSGMDRMGTGMDGMGSGMDGMGSGMDGMGSGMDRMGTGMERMGSGMDRMGSGMDRMGSGMDRMGSGMDRMGMDRMDRVSDLDRLGSGFDRMGSGLDRIGSSVDRLGPAGFDRLGPSSLDRMNTGMDFLGMDRMGSGFDRMASSRIDRFPSGGLDRMGSGGIGGQFDRPADMERGGFGTPFGGVGAGVGGPSAGANARKGCQIFVRNLPFDFNWKNLKDTFNTCGIVQYADIKMENGKSKGCGVVRFENPETAERACRTMNGYRLNGREIDVRIDRIA